MKIALVGYGKMGKVIEEIAIERNHQIVARFNSQHPLNDENWVNCDVAIEFTNPEIAVHNIEFCLNKGVAICIGSTGWYNHLPKMQQLCIQNNASMLASTNFSIGVNLYWKVAAYISKLFQNIPNYKAGIVENHHIEKKDAPSGTAITLAEKFLENQNYYTDWNLTGTYWMEDATNFDAVKSINELNDNTLPIISIREPNVPGTHQLYEIGTNDFIKLEHQANNRKGFAEGAVIAAEWLFNKKGVFSMSDMLKFEE